MHLVDVKYVSRTEIHPHKHMTHSEYVITLMDQGDMVLECGSLLKLTPNSLTLMPAGVPHRAVKGKNVSLWWLSFCAHCLQLEHTDSLLAFCYLRGLYF